jgi:uncharacterized protein
MNPTPVIRPILNLSHIRDLTIEYGEGWAYPHVCRVLQLIEEIGAGQKYDRDVTTYAAYLHDWGAFPHYQLPGVDHALRSMQVAEREILPYTTLSEPTQKAILEAIAQHDFHDSQATGAIETILLREADMVDMLGVMGVLRAFAEGPNDLKVGYERCLSRQAAIPGELTLPRAQILAKERISSMDQMLAHFREESYGIF